MAENITTFSFAFEYTYIPYFIIGFFGVTSNALLVIALIKDPLKYFKNSGTYFIINLSVSDLLKSLYGVSLLHKVIAGTSEFDMVLKSLNLTFGIVSIASIASISIDRFLLVAYPLKHHQLFTRKVMILWLLVTWMSGIALPMSGLFFDYQMSLMLAINCLDISLVLFSVAMYAITYFTLKKHSRNIAQRNATEGRAQEIRILKEKKFLKTITLIACIAFFCIVPPMISFQLKRSLDFWNDELETVMLHKMFIYIFYINFAVNPIIYVLRLPNYRKTFNSIYCKRRP